jgi:hypothetical protein
MIRFRLGMRQRQRLFGQSGRSKSREIYEVFSRDGGITLDAMSLRFRNIVSHATMPKVSAILMKVMVVRW